MLRPLRGLGLFAGTVCGFEVCADVFESEPGGFELSTRVENGLVHVVTALGITARAERVDRECPDAWSKLNHTDVGCACNAVSALLSTHGRGVKREHSAVITIHTANSETRSRVVKLFTPALVDTLQAIEVAPGNSPGPKITLKCIQGLVKREESIFLFISHPAV